MENVEEVTLERKFNLGSALSKRYAASSPRSKKRLFVVGWIAALVLASLAAYALYTHGRESTDDAFIDGHILPVNSKVFGQVMNVDVTDNQEVKKGDPLLEIDPVDFQLKIAQAKARLDAAQAEARRASVDAVRVKQLYDKDQASRQTLDQAAATAEVAQANADLAKANLDAAALDLAETRIAAPETGRVTKKAVELRTYVQVGQPLMALVTPDLWVTANFKETQLTRMKPGQKVEIEIDAYPDRAFHGHVDSVQSGTGARFSLFPPENATGNYVKVVQRVPVKIVFDEPPEAIARLAPGMSVVPVVKLD
jgi:membrane fusion protein (multidrug efflux system)